MHDSWVHSRYAEAIRSVIPARWRPHAYLRTFIQTTCDNRVYAGPFAGMRYVGESVGSVYLPKLMGIYEKEIHGVIEELVRCANSTRVIINIGAAEGYYAVGLALRMPNTRVIAYEASEKGRALLAEMAALNDVDKRISIRGFCAPRDLGSCEAGTVVVCDCEGGEETLFSEETVKCLAQSAVLIESHDGAQPGVTDRLQARFSRTHACQQIEATTRTAAEIPLHDLRIRCLPRRYIESTMDESRRDGRTWLWFTPRDPAARRSPRSSSVNDPLGGGRAHPGHPWRIPVRFIGEIKALTMAVRLHRQGTRLCRLAAVSGRIGEYGA
jgi:predicted O-methyltransferase YrrM